jgi:hypothetical protein
MRWNAHADLLGGFQIKEKFELGGLWISMHDSHVLASDVTKLTKAVLEMLHP